MSEDEKLKRADYIIYNDELQLVIPQVVQLHQQFMNTK
jgi:dephospho-CoA kinase